MKKRGGSKRFEQPRKFSLRSVHGPRDMNSWRSRFMRQRRNSQGTAEPAKQFPAIPFLHVFGYAFAIR